MNPSGSVPSASGTPVPPAFPGLITNPFLASFHPQPPQVPSRPLVFHLRLLHFTRIQGGGLGGAEINGASQAPDGRFNPYTGGYFLTPTQYQVPAIFHIPSGLWPSRPGGL